MLNNSLENRTDDKTLIAIATMPRLTTTVDGGYCFVRQHTNKSTLSLVEPLDWLYENHGYIKLILGQLKVLEDTHPNDD